MREIELLAPAANADVAIEAILHGADAVYIGGPGYGARKSAANSIDDIRRVTDFARNFRAKVYVTVNTIVYDNEIVKVERLVYDLYEAGADALIVQDMALLRLDLPPIALHASTQCDTRTPAKARFLQEAGFSQIVLARELTLSQIKEVCDNVDVPVECFVHGALCVSYSGCCHASFATTGRSANRGECAQICRLPFNLVDADGRVLARNSHLLSLKDFNALDRVGRMLDAGVSSFKIEGRLKDASYVKNVTAAYRAEIDRQIAMHPDMYCRSSFGKSEISFEPQLNKSFNRGFTHYFLDERRPVSISNTLTPKSMGEPIKDISELNNGDGISFVNAKGEYEGVMVNSVQHGRIIGNRPFQLPKDAAIYRTSDIRWQKQLAKPTATRKVDVCVRLFADRIEASDERGVAVAIPFDTEVLKAEKPQDIRAQFDRLGNTCYRLALFKSELPEDIFVRASEWSRLRREMVAALDTRNLEVYRRQTRHPENREYFFPEKRLDFHANVANRLAEAFYREHGVSEIEPALEVQGGIQDKAQKKDQPCGEAGNGSGEKISVMTTRHCILRERGLCLRECGGAGAAKAPKLPLRLEGQGVGFGLSFDCVRCEMHLLL